MKLKINTVSVFYVTKLLAFTYFTLGFHFSHFPIIPRLQHLFQIHDWKKKKNCCESEKNYVCLNLSDLREQDQSECSVSYLCLRVAGVSLSSLCCCSSGPASWQTHNILDEIKGPRQGCILKTLILKLLHLTNNHFKACYLCFKTRAKFS